MLNDKKLGATLPKLRKCWCVMKDAAKGNDGEGMQRSTEWSYQF